MAIITNIDATTTTNLPKTDIERILYNILLNAIQHSPRTGDILIETYRDEQERFVLEISDHGPGIDRAQIPHIFERFYRAEASQSRSLGGTGLGLTIAKTFADKHDIILECHSVMGEGTIMKCIFSKAAIPS